MGRSWRSVTPSAIPAGSLPVPCLLLVSCCTPGAGVRASNSRIPALLSAGKAVGFLAFLREPPVQTGHEGDSALRSHSGAPLVPSLGRGLCLMFSCLQAPVPLSPLRASSAGGLPASRALPALPLSSSTSCFWDFLKSRNVLKGGATTAGDAHSEAVSWCRTLTPRGRASQVHTHRLAEGLLGTRELLTDAFIQQIFTKHLLCARILLGSETRHGPNRMGILCSSGRKRSGRSRETQRVLAGAKEKTEVGQEGWGEWGGRSLLIPAITVQTETVLRTGLPARPGGRRGLTEQQATKPCRWDPPHSENPSAELPWGEGESGGIWGSGSG
nr:uncharacterized protein LOC116150015 [Camelus dromedarius]